jgi:hypothetical protein
MVLSLRKVTSRRELREYLVLPYQLHGNRADWVAPLLRDERRLFDARRNAALRYCDFVLWLVRDARGVPVGRVAGIVNHRYNAARSERTARFSQLEVPDDIVAARMLLDAVAEWAAGQGMNRVVGPMGFTDQDPEAFMIEGFNEAPSIATYQNAQHLPHLVAGLGYTKHVDYVVYRVSLRRELPPVYRRALARVAARGELRLLEFARRRELKPFAAPMFALMNETFADLVGYSQLDEQEIAALARRYLPVIDPRYVKLVFAGEVLAGFLIAIPDLSAGFRKAHGRLLPLGWWHIQRAGRCARRLDLLLGGVKECHRGRGVDIMGLNAMINSARNAGIDYMDSHHELETNTLVRAEMERLGGEIYKRYRLYERSI